MIQLLKKQLIMRKMILAILPCVFGAVYFFGWRSLALVLTACIVCFICEYIMCRMWKEPVSEAVFVTAILLALVMPPTVPWHVLIIACVFAIIFSKMVFGGFGRNFFNPALAGRCFVYICFPVAMTAVWAEPADGMWGALTQWTTATVPDAITSVTPMAVMKADGTVPALSGLFFGRISGTMGVTSALLILIGGVYVFVKKVAARETILSVIITYVVLNQGLHWLGADGFYGALPAVLGGGFLFGAFFMATDPVSSPKTAQGRIVYGIIIALCTTVIRNYSIFNGGLMFSILLGNMFAPIIDYGVKNYWQKK